jgi:hypothetical protein
VEGTEHLKPLIFHYFPNLFLSEVDQVDPSMMEIFLPKITKQMNEKLLAPFSTYYVRNEAFSIGDYKALGPDGLHAVFYKKNWNVCGDEIAQEVLQAVNSGVIPDGWNDTTVVLIQ